MASGRQQIASHNPIINLLGINVRNVLTKYLSGSYSNITHIEKKIKFTLSCDKGLINPAYGQSTLLDVFSFNSKPGVEYVFVCDNNIMFKRIHIEGKQGTGGKCDYCDTVCESGMDGKPFKVTTEYVGDRIVPIVWTKDLFCDYRCALTDVLRCGGNNRNNYTCNPESWLKCMFKLAYPDAGDLLPAPNRKHLISNGGSCTPQEYKSTRYSYVETGLFITYPGKEVYHKITAHSTQR